jgi:hypothetical protein
MPTLEDVRARDCGEDETGVPPEELPINFYDNDDGFWDEYIKFKLNRSYAGGMLVNRKYFFH